MSDVITKEATVTKDLSNGRFEIELENGNMAKAYVTGKMRKEFIEILPGDRVKVEFSPHDTSMGRIVYREENE